jgi:hypothetical protein
VPVTPAWLVRRYLWLLGAGLLVEGAALLALQGLGRALPELPGGFAAADTLHNGLHVLWGVAMLALLKTGLDDVQTAVLAIGFGLFYLALAVAGTLVNQPFGLRLGPGENTFHYTVGLLALALGLLAWRARPRPSRVSA